MSGYQNVHVRVTDAATGQPTPVRIRIVGPDGQYYAPLGRLTEFVTVTPEDIGGNLLLGRDKFTYIDGACEVRLPIGDVEVEIHKGPEFIPLRQQVQLPRGKMALRFVIQRWVEMRGQGWYSGDSHCFLLTPHAALLEALAEDVSVVNLLAGRFDFPRHPNLTDPVLPPGTTTYPILSNILAFSGQRPALEVPGHLVVVNTLNRHQRLGNLVLLNCHRVVHPLTFGSPDEIAGWNLADLCGQCHRKGGLVVGLSLLEEGGQGESLADAILGHIDAVEVSRGGTDEVDLREVWQDWLQFGLRLPLVDWDRLGLWQDLLRCGFRLPLVGGSGKGRNNCLLGGIRTYAYLPPGVEFNYKNWIEAVRAGRTFVTTGPMLFFTVNGQGPGSVIDITPASDASHPRPQTVQLQAEARSLYPFERLEVIHNGTVLAMAAPQWQGPIQVARLEKELPAQNPGWFCARCVGPFHPKLANFVGAHTSPVYVQTATQPFQPDAATVGRLLDRLEKHLAWVNQHCRFETESQRERMASVYRQAQAELRKRLEAGNG